MASEGQRQRQPVDAGHAWYRAIVDTIGVVLVMLDPDGTIVELNTAAERVLGVSRADALGADYFQRFLPARARAVVRADLDRVLAGQETRGFEYVVVDATGRHHTLLWNVTRLVDTAGEPVAAIAAGQDLTDLRSTESRLTQSERYHRSLIENSTEVITILDATGEILYESPSIFRVLGYAMDELVGTNVFELVHPEDGDRLREQFAEVLGRPGGTETIEVRFRHQDGSWRTLKAIGRNLLHDPAVGGVVVNSRDVTEDRRVAEQLRQSQKMEAVGRLAGGVAHDFNNVLTVIQGFARLVIDELREGDPRRDDLEEIVRAAEQGGGLARQLLQFSRSQPAEVQEVDLNEVLRSSESMLRPLLGATVRLSLDLEDALDLVIADPVQLHQVVMNLAVNARDAMPDGGRLTLRTRNVVLGGPSSGRATGGRSGPRVLLSVSDTGVGMPPEVLEHIFEPFYTTKSPEMGTGLGLSTVYGIVRQSGGHIWAYSEPAHGTEFKIYLPPARESGIPVPQTRASQVPGGTDTILVVEDDAGIRPLLARILRRAGYHVVEAATGVEALAMIADWKGPLDLVLSDVVMPEMGGRELFERLRGDGNDVPVIFLSGYAEPEAAAGGTLEAPLIEKPFEPEELLRMVRNVLDE